MVSLVGISHALVHTYELSLPILIGAWLIDPTIDVTRATLGIILAIGYGLFGIGALPSGVFVDTFGARRMIVLCLGGMAVSFVLLGMSAGAVTLTLALVMWGVFASIYHPSGLTLISTAANERGTVFAYHGIAGNLGIGLGPLVTILLLIAFDWRVVVVILAFPAALAAIYATRLSLDPRGRPDGGTSTPSTGELLTRTKLLFSSAFLGVFLLVILSGLYYRGVLTFLPDILRGFEGFEPIFIGEHRFEPSEYFFVAMLMVGMLGQYIGGRLSDRVRPLRGIVGVFIVLAALAIVFVPLATLHLASFIVVGLLLGVFLFMIQPLYQAATADHTPRAARGLSYGYMYLGVFGIGAAGSAVAGLALTYADAGVLFLVFAIVAATGATIAAGVLWRLKRSGSDRNA